MGLHAHTHTNADTHIRTHLAPPPPPLLPPSVNVLGEVQTFSLATALGEEVEEEKEEEEEEKAETDGENSSALLRFLQSAEPPARLRPDKHPDQLPVLPAADRLFPSPPRQNKKKW